MRTVAQVQVCPFMISNKHLDVLFEKVDGAIEGKVTTVLVEVRTTLAAETVSGIIEIYRDFGVCRLDFFNHVHWNALGPSAIM